MIKIKIANMGKMWIRNTSQGDTLKRICIFKDARTLCVIARDTKLLSVYECAKDSCIFHLNITL